MTRAYNQELSERRADSIKKYLADKYGIAGADLVTVGYGKSKLRDPSNPMAEVDRRVQVVNMEEGRPGQVNHVAPGEIFRLQCASHLAGRICRD